MSDNPIYDLVRQGESGADGYNAFNRGTHRELVNGAPRDILIPIGSVRHESLTTSTVGELRDRQMLPTNRAERLGAVGVNQIIEPTLDKATQELTIPRTALFDENLQDRIFSESLLRDSKHVVDYVKGTPGVSREEAQSGLAAQWASFSDPTRGDLISAYPPPANHATVSLAASGEALDTLRARYAEAHRVAVANHDADPDRAAWNAATAIPAEQRERWNRIGGAAARPRDTGTAVCELQGELNRVRPTAAPALAVTGSFDTDTTGATRAFQRAHDLAVDGVAGSKTRLALAEADGDVLAPRPAPQNHRVMESSTAPSRPVEHPAEKNPWRTMVHAAHATGAARHAPSPHPWRHVAEQGRAAAASSRQTHAPNPWRDDARIGHRHDASELHEGATGPSVRALQQTLVADRARDHHGHALRIDGVFGPRTADAVRSFQDAHGLPVDGVVGRDTQAALAATTVAPAGATARRRP